MASTTRHNGRPIQLRGATTADLDTIASVWHIGWGDGHDGSVPHALVQFRTIDAFQQLASDRLELTTVAIVCDELAGFAVISGDELEQLYVARSGRGAGIADALIDFAEQSISERHGSAWLAVVAGNGRARSFYERRGWVDAGGIDYQASTADGAFMVPSRRYEKKLLGDGAPGPQAARPLVQAANSSA